MEQTKSYLIMELKDRAEMRVYYSARAREESYRTARYNQHCVARDLLRLESFDSMWHAAVRAVMINANRSTTPEKYRRKWAAENMSRFEMHPAVYWVIFGEREEPKDWQQLLLEWPHISENDPMKLAYTRDERKGADGIHTATTLGKYFARHWPHISDHARRDWAARFAPAHVEIWDTREGIISGIELGPQSCMRSSYGAIPFNDVDNQKLLMYRAGDASISDVPWHKHPYSVYCPSLGWRIAVRIDKGAPDVVLARALINEKKKGYVRSYSHGGNDDKLEAALSKMGYRQIHSWDGLKTLRLEHPTKDGYFMPYIDGGAQDVDVRDEHFVITDCGGEYTCTNTDGTLDAREVHGECEDCGATISDEDDDHIHAGRDQGTHICASCSDNYTMVQGVGYHGRLMSYYILSDNAIEVRDRSYDPDNLPDTIVYCEDAEEYFRKCDVHYIDGTWYDPNTTDIVCDADGDYQLEDKCVKCADDEWRLQDNCWESAKGNWYADDETEVHVPEGSYHADELQEMIDNA